MSRFRLLPAPAQEAVLRDHCGHARYVWNLAVEQHAHWRLGRPGAPGYLEQCRQLTATRAEHPWLAAGSQTVQQQALRDFAGAMTAFFDPGSPAGRPSWRKAGRDRRGGLCRGRGRARRPHRRARVRRGRSRCRRGRWRRSLRWSSCLLPVRLYQFQDVRSTMMARVRTDGKRGRRTAQALAELFGIPLPFGYGKLGGGIAAGTAPERAICCGRSRGGSWCCGSARIWYRFVSGCRRRAGGASPKW